MRLGMSIIDELIEDAGDWFLYPVRPKAAGPLRK